jgi:hypothetical protein
VIERDNGAPLAAEILSRSNSNPIDSPRDTIDVCLVPYAANSNDRGKIAVPYVAHAVINSEATIRAGIATMSQFVD